MRAKYPVGSMALAASILSTLLLAMFVLWELSQHWSQFLAWKADAGFVPFFLGLALLPLVGIPNTPLFVLAGATFDLKTALIGCSIATAINLILSHWLARRWLRDWLTRFLARWHFKPPTVNVDNALTALLLVRVTPGLPAALRNYAAALIDVPFPVYLIASWTTTLIYAVGLIVLGDSLSNSNLTEAGVAVVLLGMALGAIVWFLKHQRNNRRSGQTSAVETRKVR